MTLPLAMRADGLGEGAYGWVIAPNGLLIAAVGLFSARFAAPRVLSLALLLAGIGFGLNAAAHTAPVYALGVLVWTLGSWRPSPPPTCAACMSGRWERPGVWGP